MLKRESGIADVDVYKIVAANTGLDSQLASLSLSVSLSLSSVSQLDETCRSTTVEMGLGSRGTSALGAEIEATC